MPRDDMIGLRLINIVDWLIEPRLSDKLTSWLIELASQRKHTVAKHIDGKYVLYTQ